MSIRDFVEAMEAAGNVHTRTDATNLTAFIEQELRQVTSETYARLYPELTALNFIPLKSGISPYAMSWSYDTYEVRGSADWLAALGDDLPRSDVARSRVNLPIHTFGSSYGYSMEEIEAARWAGVGLDALKAEGTRRAMETFQNNVLLLGEPKLGIPGLFTNAEVPRISAPNGLWRTTATNDQIVADLSAMVDAMWLGTSQIYQPNTLVLPPTDYRAIQTRRLSNTTDTVHDFFLRTNGFISSISMMRELETAGPGGTPTVLVYKKDPSVLQAVIPMPFQQMPQQVKNFELVTPCRQRIGGVAIYRPSAMLWVDNFA